MKEADIKHLEFIYHRMRRDHKEDENSLYMQGFKSIIDSLKPATKEPKRYRLEIPEEVPKAYMSGWDGLYAINGREVERICNTRIDGMKHFMYKGTTMHCPDSWVVEIEEKQEEGIKWVKHVYPDSITIFGRREMGFAFSEGEKSESLKHREAESQNEWYKTYDYENKTCAEIALDAWTACNKSRGYE